MKTGKWLFTLVYLMSVASGQPANIEPPSVQQHAPGKRQAASLGTLDLPGIAFEAAPSTGLTSRSDGSVGTVLSAAEKPTYAQRGIPVNTGLLLPNVDPSLVTCPVANCPIANPVLSATNIYGQTRKDASTPEWESVVGLYSATGDPGGQKVVQYLGGMQAPGAGALWTLNTDIVRNATAGGRNSLDGLPGSGVPGSPGSIGRPDSTIGYELDLTNWSEDDAPGGPFVVGMFINTLSSYSSLAGLYYGSAKAQPVPSWHDGILFAENTVKDNSIFDGSSASFSYQVAGSHLAAFYDNSRSRTGLAVNGAHSGEDILLSDTAPVGIAINGTHATAAITIAPGQKVCLDATRSCLSYDEARHKWLLTGPYGTNIASIDDDGNMTLKGKVIQGQEP